MSSLLVIGNGFDLNLGAKTSYKDFFESKTYSDTITKLEKWVNCFTIHNNAVDVFVGNMLGYDFTCWDLLFYLVSTKGPLRRTTDSIRWCDVETVIHDSLVGDIREGEFSFSWKQVDKLLFENPSSDPSDYYEQVVASYIDNHFEKGINLHQVLLDELIRFEKKFGAYIKKATGTTEYQDDAEDLVKRLCDAPQNLYVDSFNYSAFRFIAPTGLTINFGDKDQVCTKNRVIRHINGNYSNPIFGIDLTEDEKRKHPQCIRFTKTSRRLQQDSHCLTQTIREWPESVNHAVVFGHSLNRMDYDYFNYLFTILHFNAFELDKMGSIEFVYSIYNPQKADEIRSNYADAIYNLIDYYEGHVNGMKQKVLANLLRFSGKLKIRELQ